MILFIKGYVTTSPRDAAPRIILCSDQEEKFKEAVSKFKENCFSLLSQRGRKICVCIRNWVSHLCFFAPKLYRELIRHTAGVSNDRSIMCISRIRKMFKNTEYLSSLIKFQNLIVSHQHCNKNSREMYQYVVSIKNLLSLNNWVVNF